LCSYLGCFFESLAKSFQLHFCETHNCKPLEPDPTPPDTELFKTGQSILNQPPMKVYVLEQDISDTQSNVAQIKQQATFG